MRRIRWDGRGQPDDLDGPVRQVVLADPVAGVPDLRDAGQPGRHPAEQVGLEPVCVHKVGALAVDQQRQPH